MATRSFVVAYGFLMAKAVMDTQQASLSLIEGKTVFTVPLDKEDTAVLMNGREVSVRTVYSGQIFAGGPLPQNFTVIFDTGSGHLILPSVDCTDEPCKTHHRYDPAASSTATKIDFDGMEAPADLIPSERDQVEITYGTGEIIGDFAREVVCVGMSAVVDSEKKYPANCAKVRVISALQMSSEPFNSFNFDGILGLGLPALALDPEFHFFEQLARETQITPIFSFFLSGSDDVRSEITFGGYNSKRMVGGPEAVRFVPVERPQDGHWQVKIQGVRVGNTSLPFCDNGACTAIVDTGTSTLGVPSESFDDLADLTWRELSDHVRTQGSESAWPDCRQVPGPSLIFEMGDFEIVLQVEDYSRPIPIDVEDLDEDGLKVTHSVCSSKLTPLDLPSIGTGQGVFIWGKPVLQKYYTMYDVKSQRVGFVTAMHPSPEERPPSEITSAQTTTEAVLQV